MANIADVYVSVLPETSKIASGIERALRDVDVKAIARHWREEIERELKRADTKVKVDADTAPAKRELTKLERERRTATIHAKVDQASIANARRQLSSAMSGAGGALKGLGKSEAIVAGVGLAPNVVPLLGQVASAAGQLSGVLGLIPAAAGAAGLAIGSLKIGMSGFADAIKEVGDPDKFAEAIKQLAPSAQQAATAIQTLMPQVTQLKMTTQGALFAGMGEQITKLGNTYLPMFQTTMSHDGGSREPGAARCRRHVRHTRNAKGRQDVSAPTHPPRSTSCPARCSRS